MPLSPPTARHPLHHRDIALRGYHRDDGLIEVEAHLTDTKTYDFSRADGSTCHAGEPIHDMWLRLTLNSEREIVACEASMDATPYGFCTTAAANFATLAGLKIESGFLKQAMARVGGTAGCTHLRELLQQVGTVAFQTLYSVKKRGGANTGGSAARPALLNSCRAYDETGPVVRELFPEWYRGSNPLETA